MGIYYFIRIFFVVVFLSSCAVIKKEVSIPYPQAKVDFELLKKSDYVEIVYENGNFSYISYLKEEPKKTEKNEFCNKDEPIFPLKKGIYIWSFNKVFGKEKEIINELKTLGINKIYIQIDDNLEKFLSFLEVARTNDIEVFAVDGSPDYINNPAPLFNRIKKVIELNQNKKYFLGIHIDVEPYLLKDFNINKELYAKKYVNLIKKIKEITANKIKLSIVIPFWFDTIFYKDKVLSSIVIDEADEVVIMSYRTNLEEILNLALNELCYGSKVNKPIYLAVEVNPLPVEDHYLVKKEEILKNLIKIESNYFLAKLPSSGLRFFGYYKVKPENLSFYRNPEVWEILKQKIKMRSFAGWVIHSYEGLKER